MFDIIYLQLDYIRIFTLKFVFLFIYLLIWLPNKCATTKSYNEDVSADDVIITTKYLQRNKLESEDDRYYPIQGQ